MKHALWHPDRNLALAFLVGWPNLNAANRLVTQHAGEFEDRDYGLLRPAAEVLAEKYPAAATLLHQALAEDVLQRASSRQYQYVARDMRACTALAPLLPPEGAIESHEAHGAASAEASPQGRLLVAARSSGTINKPEKGPSG